MRISTAFGLAVLGSLFLSASVMAQPGGGGGGRRGGGMGGMFQQDPFQSALAALGDLNLQPDFTLTKEQKEKVQAARNDVKAADEKWRKDNADAMQKLQQDMQAAMQDQDQDKMRETMTKRRELMQTMPKTDDAVKALRAALTEDQAKALDTRIEERAAEQRARMGMMGGGRRGGRGGAGGGGGGGGGGQ